MIHISFSVTYYSIYLNFLPQIKYLTLKCYSPRGYAEMTRNICCDIISKKLKLHLNWMGSKIKKGLQGSKCASVMIGVYCLVFY